VRFPSVTYGGPQHQSNPVWYRRPPGSKVQPSIFIVIFIIILLLHAHCLFKPQYKPTVEPRRPLWPMAFFGPLTSYRLNAAAADDYGPSIVSRAVNLGLGVLRRENDHGSHPDLGHLILLVFEAVLEVVCVSLPGYIVARQGMFDQDKQKFVANLNVALFTPCLSMLGSP